MFKHVIVNELNVVIGIAFLNSEVVTEHQFNIDENTEVSLGDMYEPSSGTFIKP